jgi:hypothetical protein
MFVQWTGQTPVLQQNKKPLEQFKRPLLSNISLALGTPMYQITISTGVCIYTVCKGGGEGNGLCGVHSTVQELYIVYLTRSEPTKMLSFPK